TFYPNNAIYAQKTYTVTDLPAEMQAMAGTPMGDTVIANTLTALNDSISGYAYNYAADAEKTAEEAEGKLDLKVVGILRPKDEISFGCLSSGLYYTRALAEHARSVNYDSEITTALRAQAEAGGQDSLTGGNALLSMGQTSLPLRFGVSFEYDYLNPSDGVRKEGNVGFVGGSILSTMDIGDMMSGMLGGDAEENPEEEEEEGESPVSFPDPYSLVSLSLAALGGGDKPISFSIYPTDFENKDLVTSWLDAWNEEGDITLPDGTVLTYEERTHVTYTDTLALVIHLINSMIDVVSTALIAFTSVSLVVSTVMIGILTYVSVVERIKEIGVIRSLGGRRKDVRHLFNAETFIIGFLAGLIGVVVTALLSLLVNLLIKVLADVSITAYLPWYQAVLLIALSVGLTLVSGLIPASAAARKDPVNALRSE
ncbi:MAG: ABC transporter permease, partial [Clostridia bacterium]|nr:ABC transporter permease [Clostridia bacterium]